MFQALMLASIAHNAVAISLQVLMFEGLEIFARPVRDSCLVTQLCVSGPLYVQAITHVLFLLYHHFVGMG